MTTNQWASRRLGDLVEVLDHKRVPVSAKERATRMGPVPYYGATGRVGSIDDALFNEPLLLLGEDGVQFLERDKSKAYLIDGPAWVNNHAHVLRVLPEAADRRFLLHQLNWIDYRGHVNGTTRLKLTKSAMTALPMRLPPIYEQRRIVEILEDHLSRLDAATSVLHTAEKRTAFARVSFLRQQREVLLAEGAPLREVGEVCDTALGKMLDAKRASGRPTPYLRNINVRWGSVDLDDVLTVPLTDQEQERFTLQTGDVLVCEGGEPGRCAVWRGERNPMTFQKALHRVRPKEAIAPEFVAMMIEESVRSGRADGLLTGTTIKHLPQEKLREIRIPVPNAAAQARMLARRAALDSSLGQVRTEISLAARRAASLRRSLLTTAFEGRLTGAKSSALVAAYV